MAITLDNDIPLPTVDMTKKKSDERILMETMNVGQSFFTSEKTLGTLTGMARACRPNKYNLRTVSENGIEGVRVWRNH